MQIIYGAIITTRKQKNKGNEVSNEIAAQQNNVDYMLKQ